MSSDELVPMDVDPEASEDTDVVDSKELDDAVVGTAELKELEEVS